MTPLLAACLMVIGVGGGRNQDPIAPNPILDRHVSLNLVGEPMQSALFKFSTRSSFKMRVTAPIVTGTVDLSLVDLPLGRVMTMLLDSARPRLTYHLEGDEFVITYKEPVVTVDSPGGPAKPLLEKVVADAKSEDKVGIEIDDTVVSPKIYLRDNSLSDALREIAKRSNPAFEILEEGGKLRAVPRAGAGRPVLVTQPGHSGTVIGVSYSQDGRFIATMGDEGRVNVWNVRDGKTVHSIRGIIGDEAFSSDGKELIFAFQRGIYAMDLAKRSFRDIGKAKRDIRAIAYAPDGQLVVTDDGTNLDAWDTRTGAWVLGRTTPRRPIVFAVDRAGERLAVGMPRDPKTNVTNVYIANVRAKKAATVPAEVSAVPLRIAFTHDGTGIAVGMENGAATLLSASTGGFLRSLLPAPIPYTPRREFPFALSPDGRLFVHSLEQGRVDIRDIAGERALLSLKSEANSAYRVQAIAFDPTSTSVVVGREAFDDTTEKVTQYRVGNGKSVMKFQGGMRQVTDVHFVNGGTKLVAVEGDGARIWDTAMELPPRFIPCGRVTVQPHAEPNEPMVLVGNDPISKKFSSWDVQSGRKFSSEGPVSTQAATESVWSGDGSQIVVRDKNDRVQVWSVGSPTTVTFTPTNRPIRKMLTNRDATRILTVEGIKTITVTLWDGINGRSLKTWGESDKVTDQVAGAILGPYVAITADNRTHVLRWDTGDEFMAVDGTEPSISAGGGLLAVQVGDRSAFWDLVRGSSFLTDRGEFHPMINPEGDTWITYSPDKETAFVYGDKKKTRITGHLGPINAIDIHPNGTLIASAGADGTVRLWRRDGKQAVQLQGVGKYDYVALLPDNTYMASKRAATELTFRSGDNTYPFDQFDLRLNRPDLVMGSIGLAQPETIAMARRAYDKRLRILGVDPASLSDAIQAPQEPTLLGNPVLNTPQPNIELHIKLYDQRIPLDRLNVSIDGVPIYGSKGLNLRDRNSREIPDFPLTLPLSNGRNHVRISVLNQNGAESTKLSFYVTRANPRPAKPNLYLVSVGVADYDDPILQLSAPKRDAERVAAVMKGLEQNSSALPSITRKVPIYSRSRRGRRRVVSYYTYNQPQYAPSRTYGKVFTRVLTNKQVTRANVLAAKDFIKGATENDVVVLFFAGHGVLNTLLEYYFVTVDVKAIDIVDQKTADQSDEELSRKAVSYADIEGLLDGVKARKRLILLDTCNAGQPDAINVKYLKSVEREDLKAKTVKYVAKIARIKGTRGSPALAASAEFQKMQEFFAGLENSSGATVIGASSAGEETLDKGKEGLGLLTAALVQAIQRNRADLNRNGQIQISELRNFLLDTVISSAGGRKQATSRAENPDLDFIIR